MRTFLGLLVICAVIGIIVFVKKRNKQKAELEKTMLEEKRKREIEVLKKQIEEKEREFQLYGLPILNAETLILTRNEVCHFLGNACFCRLKNHIIGYEGGSRGVSFRVMKGISFRVGNYQGHSIKQDSIEKTNGKIYLTNKKLIFSAISDSSVINYDEIISINNIDEIIQIQTNKKTFLFQVDDFITFVVVLEQILDEKTE